MVIPMFEADAASLRGRPRNFTSEEMLDLLDVRLVAGVALEQLDGAETATAGNVLRRIVGRLEAYTPSVQSIKPSAN